MKHAPRGERHPADSLDEFASDLPASAGRGADATADSSKPAPRAGPPDELAPLQGPPPTTIYLSDIDGLDAFALDEGPQRAGAQGAPLPAQADPPAPPPRQVPSDARARTVPAGAAGGRGRTTRASGGVASGVAAARVAAPAHKAPAFDRSRTAAGVRRPGSSPSFLPLPAARRPRLATYLYATASVAILATLTIALLNLETSEPPVDEPALARNDAPPAPQDAMPNEPPVRPLEPPLPTVAERATSAFEPEPRDPPSRPAPSLERSAPDATSRPERQTSERPVARPSFPASQSRPAPVPTTGVSPNLSQDSNARPPANTESVTALPRAAAAPSANATTSATPPPSPSSAAAVPPTSTTPSASLTPPAASTPELSVNRPAATPPAVAGLATPPASAPAAPEPRSPNVAPAPPAAATPAPASAAPALSAVEVDTRAIRGVLDRYRNAFNTLDASAAQQAWPTVNQRALERAFDRLDEQNVSFDRCQINVRSPQAQAVCGGTVRYVPSVGSRSPQVERRQWTFTLRQDNNGWVIQGIETR